MIITISSGAHWRNVGLKPGDYSEDQFAHIFDPDEPEDVPHQAHNFMTYATALGACAQPFVLIAPEDEDEPEQSHVHVEMSDWQAIVESETVVKVEIA